MNYPSFLKEKDTIGLVAPSFGACGTPYGLRHEQAKNHFSKLGYTIQEVKHVNELVQGQSAFCQVRAKEFMEMYENPSVHFIHCVAGGEKELQILPFIDFNQIKASPAKYVMGYSDNTILTFTLATICDIATIYGINFNDFGTKTWDKCIKNTYQLMLGKKLKHPAFSHIQLNDLKYEKPFASYNLEFPNEWKNLNKETIDMSGRIIGGCLDVLVNLCGTKYDQVKEFAEKYKEDGIIWYFEACDLNPFGTLRSLWQLKEAGWFIHTKGFIMGRAKNPDSVMDYTHEMAVQEILEEFNVPILLDFDTGHVPPMIPIINGSIAHVINNKKQHTIEFILK